ncbi:hypothetical protein KDA00_00100 [Candidatus Saccharibacteria bacterium]|nr:hypothetical protein [Candidatus Saccharibacteria bacterium]
MKIITSKKSILNLIKIVLLIVIFTHSITWLIANSFPENRILADIHGRFNLDAELSVTTWFSSILWLFFGTLCLLISRQHKGKQSFGWLLLAITGFLASIDEVAALHELLLQGLHILAQFGEGRQSLIANAWLIVLPLILFFAIIGIKIIKSFVPSDTKRSLMIGFSVFLIGAVIFEYISIPFDKSLSIYSLGIVIVEEGLEITGVILLIASTTKHISRHEQRLAKHLRAI